jgi:hypothetical protein
MEHYMESEAVLLHYVCLLFRPFVAPDGREMANPKRKLKHTLYSFTLASVKFAFSHYETSNAGMIAI